MDLEKMVGKFIVFEGPDGSGKSTQMYLLKVYLEKKGYKVLLTREPGDAGQAGDEIRMVVLGKELLPLTGLYLMLADRTEHVAKIINPALKQGKIVISDRYAESSLAYQGYGSDIDLEYIKRQNEMATQGLIPDIVLILDIDAEQGIKRTVKRRTQNIIDKKTIGFHEKVREGYLEIAKKNPDLYKIIDASGEEEQIHLKVKEYVNELLGI